MSQSRDKAVELLQHYIKLAAEHGPRYLALSGDSFSEIESIVDLIVDAAVEKFKAELAASSQHFHPQAFALIWPALGDESPARCERCGGQNGGHTDYCEFWRDRPAPVPPSGEE